MHGKYPDLADEILMSYEVDIIAKNRPLETERLNAIGIESQFHVTNGYYADPVEIKTAILPRSWKYRVVHLKLDDPASTIRAYCIEPHDLTVAKLAASREKDYIFIQALLDRSLLDVEKVKRLILETSVPGEKQVKMSNAFMRLVNQSIDSSKGDVVSPGMEAKSFRAKGPK